ncbi:MAG: Do family serine endopeptidase [Desulfobacterales bacterium]|nr:Do family serine endopeptidase [Desulfobacterales bacterium]
MQKQIYRKSFLFCSLITGMIIVLMCSAGPSAADSFNRETAIVKTVKQIGPAVVNINSEYEVRQRNPFSGFSGDPFFDSFFKDFFDPGFERRQKRSSLGSGVIIDGKEGFVLTNAHVVVKTAKVSVVLKDERSFEAEIVGIDPDSDLAVLKIKSDEPLPDIEMGNSNDLMIGETVVAIGNPFGFSNTVTTGIISAVDRSIRTNDRVFHNFIQTDASINPGNSGGPLLNINGELIGINTAIYAKAQGIGFAIPINKAKKVINDLILYGEVIPIWVGIVTQDIDTNLAQYMGLKDTRGVLVKKVEKKSPAVDAGIMEGDIIKSISGQTISSKIDYEVTIRDFANGDSLAFDLLRDGKKKSVTVTAGLFPEKLAPELAMELLGVMVEDQKTPLFNASDKEQGVVISQIDSRSELAGIGVHKGDIIHKIDALRIGNTKDFEKAIIKCRKKSSIVVMIQRGNQFYNITVKL